MGSNPISSTKSQKCLRPPPLHGELLHKSRMAVFPITRAPTSAVSSPVTRLAGLSQGRSRIAERSPVTGFSQTSPSFVGLRSGGPFGAGATFAPKSRIGDVWPATLPQSDKGRVARDPRTITNAAARSDVSLPRQKISEETEQGSCNEAAWRRN